MKDQAIQLLRRIPPAVAGGAVVLALGAWFAVQAMAAYRTESLDGSLAATREQVAGQVGLRLQELLSRLEALRVDVAVIGAAGRGDAAKLGELVTKDWPGVQAVELHGADLETAFADPKAFGYGKLGLLYGALQANASQAAVVSEGGGAVLGLAAPVLDAGQVAGLLYVRLPVDGLVEPLAAAGYGGGYLALRQGRYSVAEAGEASLAHLAEVDAIRLPGTNLRIVAAAPVHEGLGSTALGLLAVLCAVGAGGLLLAPGVLARRRAAAGGGAVEAEPTLGELQASGQLVPEPPAPAHPEAQAAAAARTAAPRATLNRSIFRAYDIRGIVGQTLDAEAARLIGQAVGSLMNEKGARSIVVGRDGRESSPQMADALIDGLRKAGREVIDIGQAPTPLSYFAAYHLHAGSCISVTGSHNPPDYNGFKIVVDGDTLAGDDIQALYARIADGRLHVADAPGMVSRRDVSEDYVQRVAGDIQIERKLRVVVDCGSGVAGALAPRLLEAIGAEVEPLFCEVDGSFPHHHPDPSDPDNLRDLIDVVARTDADLGLALDGDGDRLGVVTKGGEIIYPDRVLMLFAADVLERNPGACVIYDVKCTGHLATHILRHGGSPLMWKTGHSLIKAKMRETEAELAGEMSGHFFFRERWYGFDDALYAAARLLEILSTRPEDPQEVFDTLPKGVSTPELKIPVAEGQQYSFIERFVAEARFEGARLATIDGLRADWPDGWGLVRASNTTPVLVLRFDARDAEALARIQEAFRAQLLAVDPELSLPF